MMVRMPPIASFKFWLTHYSIYLRPNLALRLLFRVGRLSVRPFKTKVDCTKTVQDKPVVVCSLRSRIGMLKILINTILDQNAHSNPTLGGQISGHNLTLTLRQYGGR